MKRSWYEIRDADGGEVEVLLYDEIGYFGVSAADFVKELQAVKAGSIKLRINSPGGDVFDGIAIYNALKDHKARVDSVVEGLAASSASFIAQAGDTVLMARGATMMIHEPNGMTVGDAAEHLKMAEVLDKMGNTIASLYAARAGGIEAEWRQRMRAETWYRAQEAVDAKLADGLVQTADPQNRVGIFNLSKFKHVPDWVPQADAGDVVDEAIASHTTEKAPESQTWEALTLSDFTSESWDSLTDAEKSRIARHFVWTASGTPPARFSDLGGGHHLPSRSGVGAVVWRAVSSGRMSQATWSEDAGVRAHLAAHYRQFDRTPPWEEDKQEASALVEALRDGVSEVVKKRELPHYDFASAVKAGVAREGG